LSSYTLCCVPLTLHSVLAGVFEIKIKEGDAVESFIVPTALLEQHAPWLFNSIRDRQIPDHPNSSELKDTNIVTFAAVVHWLGNQHSNGPANEPFYVPGLIEGWGAVMPLIRIYEFANTHDIRGLRVDVIHRLSFCIEAPNSTPPKTLPLTPVDQVHIAEVVSYVHTEAP
jgi:hypothetical protein